MEALKSSVQLCLHAYAYLSPVMSDCFGYKHYEFGPESFLVNCFFFLLFLFGGVIYEFEVDPHNIP